MRVLVTGATGMLGRAVVSDLLTNGHTVAAMSRRVRRRPGVEPVLADLTDGTGLDAAVDGAHAIVHERTGHITWKRYLTDKCGPATSRRA
jgi:uncharacterized protein YbjT (DUF2867 family)